MKVQVPVEDPECVVSRILSEETIDLAAAQTELAAVMGKKPDRATLWRWCTKGTGGIKLDHVRIGHRVMTSKQALNRFIVAMSSR